MNSKTTINSAPLPINPDCYYSPPDTAQALDTSERTLESWRLKGIGPEYVRLGGRLVRYRGSALLKFADDNTFSSTSEEAARRA